MDATVTELGYLYCAPCAKRLGKTGLPVYPDSAPHNDEPCESCGRPAAAFLPGDRVTAVIWGERKVGTVAPTQGWGRDVVWVQWDGSNGLPLWVHRMSLQHVGV